MKNKKEGLLDIAKRVMRNKMYGKAGGYQDRNIKSIGGHIGIKDEKGKRRWIGGAMGLAKGKPFMKANINGKSVLKLGPQMVPENQ